ncbi:MAG: class I SAM-dependent methyltransferase [Ignavibacteriales bacterium]|nr:class I SAM-dependent methyltransferase [Ignavibacteriales bacterium]
MRPGTNIEQVRSAFDGIADSFDDTYENDTTREIRNVVYTTAAALVRAKSRLLDVNCGTGIDALIYARMGYTVVGCDLSQKMIEQATRKRDLLQLDNVTFTVASFENLEKLPRMKFDLVTSNFGGLNCVSDLSIAAREIAGVTAPGGFFLGVVMPPVSLWEILANALRGKWRQALRRLGNGAPATGFKGKSFTVFYHSHKKIQNAFRPWFEPCRIRGLNVISPPPHALRFSSRWTLFSRFLVRVDRFVAILPFFRILGDHTMIVLRRNPL